MFTLPQLAPNLHGTINLPASKSISNRLLAIRFLSQNDFEIKNLSTSDDTVLMETLLAEMQECRSAELDCENAGTVFRFLTAICAITEGNWTLTGCAQMQKRPIKPLVDALKSLGATIEYLGEDGFPPLRIQGKTLEGGDIKIDSSISSQFISALLLIAPCMKNGLNITLDGEHVSLPYIQMTANLIHKAGAKANFDEQGNIKIEGLYTDEIPAFTVEADWTSASYFYALAVLAKEADLFIPNLQKDSIQGDAIVAELFDPFGIKTRFTEEGAQITKCMRPEDVSYMDFTNHPDLAQTMAVLCAMLGLEADLSGVETLKYKETDRLLALRTELKKIGIRTEYDEGSLLIFPANIYVNEPIATYNDHRMAMAFSLLSARLNDIQIENPEVVSKSFPGYWEELRKFEMV